MHCIYSSALVVINTCFDELLEEQEFLETPEQWNKVLKLVPKKVAEELDREWKEKPVSSCDKWGRLHAEVKVTMSNYITLGLISGLHTKQPCGNFFYVPTVYDEILARKIFGR